MAFQGRQCPPAARNTDPTDKTGPVLALPLPPTPVQFWMERL